MEKELANTHSASASNLLPVSNCQKVIIKYQNSLPQGSSGERNFQQRREVLGEDKGPKIRVCWHAPLSKDIKKTLDVDLLGWVKTLLSVLFESAFFPYMPTGACSILHIYFICVYTHVCTCTCSALVYRHCTCVHVSTFSMAFLLNKIHYKIWQQK